MAQAADDAEQLSVFSTCGPYVMCVAVKGNRMSLSGCHREEAAVSVCSASPPVQLATACMCH